MIPRGSVPDVELLRALLLMLEGRQRSPREPIMLSIAEISAAIDVDPKEVAAYLDLLFSLELIDGAGQFEDKWIFKKLTTGGSDLADRIRDDRDWEDIKHLYS